MISHMRALLLLKLFAGTAIWLWLGTRYSPPLETTSVLGDITPERH
jgi:hypothetical protein